MIRHVGDPPVPVAEPLLSGRMAADLVDVRLFVYEWFARTGGPPSLMDVGRAHGLDETAVLAMLRKLHDAHLLVLDEQRRDIVMAHPWSAQPMGFVVAGPAQKWWGGCVWDSFAIPAMVGRTCLVATHCGGCGAALALDVRPDRAPIEPWVAHLPVPVLRMWDDVMGTCRTQLLFCRESHVDEWAARNGTPRGAVLDLRTLWTLATRWYHGLMTRGYRRRTDAEAAMFFAGIGLTGEFWRTA